MINKHFSSEKGQSTVLLALAFVVLLGFTALAVDGGLVYANRRHMQNAADASSLSGGSAAALYLENHDVTYGNWDCNDPDVIAAQNSSPSGAKAIAINSAIANDYIIDDDDSDDHGVFTGCVQSYDNGAWIEKFIDVRVRVTGDTPTAFAHLVYNGPLRNTVEAVTRVEPPTSLVMGNAIVALGSDCLNDGIEFDGTQDTKVSGGGIYSNSCIDTRGSGAVIIDDPYNLDVHDISCALPDCYNDHGSSGLVSPTPEEGLGRKIPKAAYDVPEPNCGNGWPYHGNYDGDGNLEPGIYDRILIQNGDHTMDPGLYCVNNGVIINGGSLIGSDVTFYLLGGDFDSSGNATISLIGPPSKTCEDPCTLKRAAPGVLIYLDWGNTGSVTMLGNEDSEYMGLVFAPDGTIEAGGTSSTMATVHAQMVGKRVFVHGNTSIVINYDESKNFILPASLQLQK